MQVRIGHTRDVAEGRMRMFDLGGTKVTVAKSGGHLYAFDDRCTHSGCSLASGALEGTRVTCPCHGSQFDVTSGAVLRGPATRPTRSRLVRVEGNDVLLES
jgi:nitrite reductase/ring-hydroxylating ferredoxin subunit